MLTITEMVNLWLENDVDGIIALSQCMIAPPDVQADLQQAHSLGEKQVESYIQERFFNFSTNVFATVKANRLKTFETQKKKKTLATTQNSSHKNGLDTLYWHR